MKNAWQHNKGCEHEMGGNVLSAHLSGQIGGGDVLLVLVRGLGVGWRVGAETFASVRHTIT